MSYKLCACSQDERFCRPKPSHCTTACGYRRSLSTEALRFRDRTHFSAREFPAVQTVKAALIAATQSSLWLSLSFPLQRGERQLRLTISIDRAIRPAAVSCVKDALALQAERRAEVVILRLNTSGGLTTSMRAIVADVMACPFAPEGKRGQEVWRLFESPADVSDRRQPN